MYVLSVTTTPSAWAGTNTLAHRDDRIRTALGLHPQIAHERKGEMDLFDQILPQARYVGEIGLDGTPELRRFWQDQVDVFERILSACEKAGGRIMSVHSRRASKPVLDALAAHRSAGTPVLHWFSGPQSDLARAVELGCWFSVGTPMLTSAKGRDLVARMPKDRILTESDGPFVQVQGKAAFPWDVSQTVAALAPVWGVSTEEAHELLAGNLRRLVDARVH